MMSEKEPESSGTLPDSWVERSKYLRKNTDMTWEEITEKINEEYGSEAPTHPDWVGTKTRDKIEEEEEKRESENQEKKKEDSNKEEENKTESKESKPSQRDRIAEIEGDEDLDDDDMEIEMDGKTSKKLPTDPKLIFLFVLWIVAIIMLAVSTT